MVKIAKKTLIQAIAIVVASAIIAATTNYVRPDGIPLITDIAYEIFAPCKDSEALSEAADVDEIACKEKDRVLYVDARPADDFASGHVQGAINVPYSALFGASKEDIAKVESAVQTIKSTTVIVYGIIADPASRDKTIDFGKPLAQQLIETGIKGVHHIEGGLKALNKTGIQIVKGDGVSR